MKTSPIIIFVSVTYWGNDRYQHRSFISHVTFIIWLLHNATLSVRYTVVGIFSIPHFRYGRTMFHDCTNIDSHSLCSSTVYSSPFTRSHRQKLDLTIIPCTSQHRYRWDLGYVGAVRFHLLTNKARSSIGMLHRASGGAHQVHVSIQPTQHFNIKHRQPVLTVCIG